jgi:hypothetical protein
MATSSAKTPETGSTEPTEASSTEARPASVGPLPDPISFLDMKQREDAERERLRQRKFELEERKRENGGVLEPPLEDELEDIKKKLGRRDVVDPLFRAVSRDWTTTSSRGSGSTTKSKKSLSRRT